MGKGRAPCCDKDKVKRGPWSPAEDLKLTNFIQKHGHENWRALPKQAGQSLFSSSPFPFPCRFFFNFIFRICDCQELDPIIGTKSSGHYQQTTWLLATL